MELDPHDTWGPGGGTQQAQVGVCFRACRVDTTTPTPGASHCEGQVGHSLVAVARASLMAPANVRR